MPSIEEITLGILRREGGYVDDPSDPGGATNHGVTIHTLRRLGVDLDGDGDVDKQDVKLLTTDRAGEIFREHYFVRPRIGELPDVLHASVYDMYVNAGANAVKVLQRLLRDFAHQTSVDGAIGPKTIAAAKAAYVDAPDHLADAYGIARRNYYYDLADQRPTLRKYARRRDGGKGGWILRAEEFISARYHLTRQQHDNRVRDWA
ncbi:MAG: peptidoglycan-binding protein [Rhodobacteraceae bacterium]|nr:peptidoglycan-binding protein [Paracoccaceae bacterium]